jgi:hypothetical protein
MLGFGNRQSAVADDACVGIAVHAGPGGQHAFGVGGSYPRGARKRLARYWVSLGEKAVQHKRD